MKTLDEVIKSFEWCIDDSHDDCDGCPYETGEVTDCHVRNVDALHYLKELKEEREQKSQMIEDAHKAIEAEKERITKAVTYNPPLTWDELKTMEGKPVWVEALLYKQWAVIAYVGDDHIRFEGVNLYAPESRIYMGDANGWQAYRKERA